MTDRIRWRCTECDRIVRIAYIRGQTAGLAESLEMSRAAEARIMEMLQ